MVSGSVRIWVRVELEKPVKKGTDVEFRNTSVWVPFKYESFPSFCYICGIMGYMKRECDLLEKESDIVTMPEEKLPFGEWMRFADKKGIGLCGR
ncbi:hypothetical protein ACS0TY_016216 [Phlomoides rotata]